MSNANKGNFSWNGFQHGINSKLTLPESTQLKNTSVIDAVYFDRFAHFAGIDLKDTDSDDFIKIGNTTDQFYMDVPDNLQDSELIKIAGFRTSRSC